MDFNFTDDHLSIQKLIRADYTLGFRKERPRRGNLPPWPFGEEV